MSDREVQVRPTPIQRNDLDVATELTELYYKFFAAENIEDMQETFVKFYAVVYFARLKGKEELINFLPEEMKQMLNKNTRY